MPNSLRNFGEDWQSEKLAFPSLSLWWDAGKARIKDLSRASSRHSARQRRSQIQFSWSSLISLHRPLDAGEDVSRLIAAAKTELEQQYLVDGTQVRARERWAEDGERSTAFFLHSECRKGVHKLFDGIKDSAGHVVHSIDAIIRVWILFYSCLFSAIPLIRPISLLSTDYKILAKVLTTRLSQLIASVVALEQVSGVPGHSSAEHVRCLQDLIDHAVRSNRGGAVISLDQEKAFDWVDWSFLLGVLYQMNFGPSFCKWISLLYTSIYSQVIVNNFLGAPFTVTRGVRQCCPLSHTF